MAIQRRLSAHGHECVVIAPSLIQGVRATGSRPIDGTPPAWRDCIAPAN